MKCVIDAGICNAMRWFRTGSGKFGIDPEKELEAQVRTMTAEAERLEKARAILWFSTSAMDLVYGAVRKRFWSGLCSY
jgi:hypothetical protein